MKRNSKHSKRVRNLILVCVMSALLLTVGTYAWFIGMQTVKVNSFEVKIAAVDSLKLSMNGLDWHESLDVTTTEAYEGHTNEFLKGSEKGLKPISTIGEFDTSSSRLKLFEKASLTANGVGGYRLMASRVNNYDKNNDVNKSPYENGDGYVVFDLFVMNLSGDEYYKEITTPSNEEAIYLTYESKVTAGSTGTTDAGIENSVRVAFAQVGRVSASGYYPLDKSKPEDLAKQKVITGITCAGVADDDKHKAVTGICRNAQIWEPNENTHTAAAKKWYETTCKARTTLASGKKGFAYDKDAPCETLDEYITTNAVAGEIVATDYVDVYDVAYNKYPSTSQSLLKQVETFTDADKADTGVDRQTFMTLAPNSITKVRVYIWIEGQDIDNFDFASLGHSISLNFGFTKERITSGEIHEDIKPNEGPGGNVDAEQLPDDEVETPVQGS